MKKNIDEATIEFNKYFIGYFGEKNKFSEILNYAIEDGKRIRPLLLLAAYEMISGKEYNKTVLNYAIALELVHNYSLVHDDLPAMDNDDYRRNKLTVHKKFGEDLAILAGDSLLNEAFIITTKEIAKNVDVSYFMYLANAANIIANHAGKDGMILGQVEDILELSENLTDIKQMYINKTCKLISAATVAGAYLARADVNKIKEMYELGTCIGLAFQLKDDILDQNQDNKIGKKTYIKYSNLEDTKKYIEVLTNKALEIIGKYPRNEFLLNLAKKMVYRNF